MWIKFVVDSRPCSEVFSPGGLVSLPNEKQTFPNSISSLIEDPHESQLSKASLNVSISSLNSNLPIYS